MGFTSHQQMSAATSLDSIMVIGPHHAAVTHVGDSSEVGRQREHMVRQGFTGKCWSEFLCLGGYLAPPRQVGGFVPRGALGRHPSAGPRRWRPAGGPVAGAHLTYNTSSLCDATFTLASAGYRLEIFTIQELLQSVTSLTRCPRFGY